MTWPTAWLKRHAGCCERRVSMEAIDVIMQMVRRYDDLFDMNAMHSHAMQRRKKLIENRTGEDLSDDRGFVMAYTTMNHYLIESNKKGAFSKEASEIAGWEYNGETNIYPFYLWHTDKVSYRFDPEVEELLQQQAQSFDEDMAIPAQVFQYMPHRVFFIKTRTSPLSESDRKYMKKRHKNSIMAKESEQIGFFCHYGDVYTIREGIVRKDNERKNMEIFVLSQRKETQEVNIMPISLMFTKNDTGREILENAVHDFFSYGDIKTAPGSMEYDAEYNLCLSILKWAMQYVLYLCSENAEIEQDPVNRQMYRHPTPGFVKNKPREVLLLEAGKKTGALIHAFKQKKRGNDSAGSGIPVKKSPHVRRAHWHHYWVGKMNTDQRRLVVKWVAPAYIHKELASEIRPSVGIVN